MTRIIEIQGYRRKDKFIVAVKDQDGQSATAEFDTEQEARQTICELMAIAATKIKDNGITGHISVTEN